MSTDWLGLIIEEASGRTLGAYLAEHVYGPLKMVESTFGPTGEQRARLIRSQRYSSVPLRKQYEPVGMTREHHALRARAAGVPCTGGT